jgi:hypothetical protein
MTKSSAKTGRADLAPGPPVATETGSGSQRRCCQTRRASACGIVKPFSVGGWDRPRSGGPSQVLWDDVGTGQRALLLAFWFCWSAVLACSRTERAPAMFRLDA